MPRRKLTPEEITKMAAGRKAAADKRAAEAKAAANLATGLNDTKLAEEPAPEVMPALGEGPRVSDPEDEMAPSEPPQAGMTDPFQRFLAELDDETRELLTEEDGSIPQLEAIWAARVKAAKDARREVAKKQATARADRMAKTDAGLVSPQDAAAAALQRSMDRKVSWVVEMARDANGNLIDEGYRINGELLYHGRHVTGTYGEWLSYREMVYRARNHEMDFEGKGLLNEQRRLSTGALSVKFTLGAHA